MFARVCVCVTGAIMVFVRHYSIPMLSKGIVDFVHYCNCLCFPWPRYTSTRHTPGNIIKLGCFAYEEKDRNTHTHKHTLQVQLA